MVTMRLSFVVSEIQDNDLLVENVRFSPFLPTRSFEAIARGFRIEVAGMALSFPNPSHSHKFQSHS